MHHWNSSKSQWKCIATSWKRCMGPFLHGASQTLWYEHFPLSLICCSVMNDVNAAHLLQSFTHLFTLRLCVGEHSHPLRLLLSSTFNTTAYNNSYSWQVNWGFSAGPLLGVRLKPFYHTTFPVMDVHSSNTVLSEASGLEPVTQNTLLNSSAFPSCCPWVPIRSAPCSRQYLLTNWTAGLLAFITVTHHYPES